MKRIILLFFLFCGMATGLPAQDMATVFIAVPDSYIPQLENEWRKDLVDLYTNGKEAKLQNMMGGEAELKQLTPDFLSLRSTERTTIEMKLLPLVNNTHIICMVTTVEGPVADSRVSFFTTEWEPLEISGLFTPVTKEWFVKEDADLSREEVQYALAHLDMDLIRYELHPENQTLSAYYMSPFYLNKEDREQVLPYLKEAPKVYTWEKTRFN
ncbi:MAG: DUF3256 family protein [Tannerellaceae bacterium]|nr:DUF3256 family protein [Tannerellaceae bacterium]MCC8198494.1 DUF3256 family protein [Tannerellaceae bacterium]